MTHLTCCQCGECAQLDARPTRLQGIAGAWQTTFDSQIGSGMANKLPSRSQMIIKRQASPDTLPLFVGSLEPTLF